MQKRHLEAARRTARRSWRRSVYVYRKRGLPFPMFEVFDLPDQNISCGRRNVSTVPTQALTLLNDEFVLRQAKLFADRVRKRRRAMPAKQVDLAYRIALVAAAARRRSGSSRGVPAEADRWRISRTCC